MNNLSFVLQVTSINSLQNIEIDTLEKSVKSGKSQSIKISEILDRNKGVVRAYEVMNSCANKEYSNMEKLIGLSNMIFRDDERFAEALIRGGFTREKLLNLDDAIKRIKILVRKNPDLYINHPLLDEMAKFSIKYFGIKYPHVVINKANQLLVLKPELLQQKQSKVKAY